MITASLKNKHRKINVQGWTGFYIKFLFVCLWQLNITFMKHVIKVECEILVTLFLFYRTGKGTEFFSGRNQSNTCGKSKFFNFSKLHVIKKMGYQRRKKCHKYADIILL